MHLALRNHLLWLPNDDELLSELGRVRLRETGIGQARLDHDSGDHDDQAVALAIIVAELIGNVPRPGGPVIFTEEDIARERLIDARRDGLIPEPVPVIGGRAYGGDWAMPYSVDRPDDFDQSMNGKTARSPFR